jgi:hypothetical protein
MTAHDAVAPVEAQRERLAAVLADVRAERIGASTPAVEAALQQAELHLFLALTYLGYTETLFPEER